MAVTSVYRKPGTRSGSRTRTAREGTEVWIVETDDPADNDLVVLAQFVAPGGAFGGRVIGSLSCSESSEDGLQWEVTVKYAASPVDNPLAEPAVLSISPNVVQVATDYDRDGTPILNTAGDPFGEIIFLEDVDDTVQITKNFATIPIAAATSAKRSIGTLSGIPGQARYRGMSVQQQDHDQIGTYYTCTIEFAMADTWERRILNQGFREKDNGELKPIKIDGKEISQPVLLDASGKQLTPSGTPHDVIANLYKQVSYNALFGV